jgi:hypothetical protein
VSEKSANARLKSQEGLIVGPDGVARWGKFDPNTIYIPLKDGRNVPVPDE